MKYLLLFPILAFAGEPEINQTIINEYTENTYIEYKAHDETFAAMAAIASIPSLSHRTSHHKHSAVGLGAGSYNDSTGLGINIQHQTDSVSLKANIGVSGVEKVYGFGITVGF